MQLLLIIVVVVNLPFQVLLRFVIKNYDYTDNL